MSKTSKIKAFEPMRNQNVKVTFNNRKPYETTEKRISGFEVGDEVTFRGNKMCKVL